MPVRPLRARDLQPVPPVPRLRAVPVAVPPPLPQRPRRPRVVPASMSCPARRQLALDWKLVAVAGAFALLLVSVVLACIATDPSRRSRTPALSGFPRLANVIPQAPEPNPVLAEPVVPEAPAGAVPEPPPEVVGARALNWCSRAARGRRPRRLPVPRSLSPKLPPPATPSAPASSSIPTRSVPRNRRRRRRSC